MKRTPSLLFSLIAALAFFSSASALFGATRIDVGGVVVTYTWSGMDAYYDPNDDTLTIVVTQSGGSLSVTVTAGAQANWGGYVDVFLAANDVQFKSVKLIGRAVTPVCKLYVTGQCYNITTFTLNNGFVGGTDFYEGRGIGTSSPYTISTIKMKNAVTYGPLAGVDYSAPTVAGATTSGSVSKAGVARVKLDAK